MAIVSQITGVDEVLKAFEKAEKAQPKRVEVVVGFRTNYALSVHERVEMKWKGLPRGAGFSRDKEGRVIFSESVLRTGTVGGGGKGFYWDPQGQAQAKFLETPAREKRARIAEIVTDSVERGASLEQGLVLAGLFLQREAQQLTPVDTGKLKASAFTKVEKRVM